MGLRGDTRVGGCFVLRGPNEQREAGAGGGQGGGVKLARDNNMKGLNIWDAGLR